jgi:hypothetical protein
VQLKMRGWLPRARVLICKRSPLATMATTLVVGVASGSVVG